MSDPKLENKVYWLVSAPKTNEDTFNTLNKRTTDEADLSINYKFPIPDLKVGTLDSLMSLSDDLVKMDSHVENVTRKIAAQLFDILEPKADKYESLSVNNNSIDTYVQYFRWDEAKYPTSQPLKSLSETIHSEVCKLDEELKIKTSEYNNLTHALNQEERKTSGNLISRDLTDIIKPEHVIVQSEYMTTVFVVVPKYSSETFRNSYEKLTQWIIPRSGIIIKEDGEYQLWAVSLFRKVVDEFKGVCRDYKYIVRDFTFNPEKAKGGDKKKLETEKEKQKKVLVRWCKTNFSESFVAWLHLKAVRVFVESVLRYGLPTNFQAMMLLPHKGKSKKLRKILTDLYGYLSSKAVFSKDEEEDAFEKFFPYVFLEINLDFRKQGTV